MDVVDVKRYTRALRKEDFLINSEVQEHRH